MTIQIINSRKASCHRCGGRTGIGEDQFGRYVQCLMCGRSVDIQQTQGKSAHRSNPVLSIPRLGGTLESA